MELQNMTKEGESQEETTGSAVCQLCTVHSVLV